MNRMFLGLSRLMALAGGIVLSLLILLTCVSIAGRLLNTILHSGLVQGFAPDMAQALITWGVGPILGDYELVEAGVAFAIFAFLPLCQISGAHATVDIFAACLPARVNRLLLLLGEVLFACALVVIVWRLEEGLQGKIDNGQTTFLLQFPLWWSYAASLAAASIAALVAVYVALARIWELCTGQILLEMRGEAQV